MVFIRPTTKTFGLLFALTLLLLPASVRAGGDGPGGGPDLVPRNGADIAVTRSGFPIADNATDDAGTITVGTPRTITYAIQNTGTGTLTVSLATVSHMSNNCSAVVTTGTPFSLNQGQSKSLEINIKPLSAGTFTVKIEILGNVAGDKATYLFTITGMGEVPAGVQEINLQRSGTDLYDGAMDSIGSVTAGGSMNLTYTIQNLGTGDLTLGATPVTMDNQTNCAASVTVQPSSPVASSGVTTFTVQVTPTAPGSFSFEIDVASDDADESTYDLTVTGLAPPPPTPAISVTGDTNFTSAAVGTPVTATWQVDSTGAAALTLSAIAITGASINEFSLSTLPSFPHTIAAGGKITIKVTYTPASAGPAAAVIRFISDSGGTAGNLTDMAISGVVVAMSKGKGSSCATAPGRPSLPGLLTLFAVLGLLLLGRRRRARSH